MSRPLGKVLLLAGAYALAWTVSYLLVMFTRGEGLDLRFLFEYLVLAWTFRGGVLPVSIWLLSLLILAGLAGVRTIAARRRRRSRRTGVPG